jgi:hypothetical protein
MKGIMNNDGLWAIGILIAAGYGLYRLIKRVNKSLDGAVNNILAQEWRCAHNNEPNHDRISCANGTATLQVLSVLGAVWVFSKL